MFEFVITMSIGKVLLEKLMFLLNPLDSNTTGNNFK